jgi:hypothetical protein
MIAQDVFCNWPVKNWKQANLPATVTHHRTDKRVPSSS